jgi:20S proteasome alpha/beta subunit
MFATAHQSKSQPSGPVTHTKSIDIYSASVIAMKVSEGILIGTNDAAFYGNMLKHKNVPRYCSISNNIVFSFVTSVQR